MTKKSNLLLFGGSFDPIHLGHLSLLKSAINFIKPDQVFIIPAFLSPFKINTTISLASDRLEMLTLALKSANLSKIVQISNYEIDMGKSVYSVDTINYFYHKYRGKNIYFMVGQDSYDSFHKWYNFKEIFNYAKLLVFLRSEIDIVENTHLESYRKSIVFMNNKIINISSSDVRNSVKNELSVDSKIPKSVGKYILEHKLYR